MLPKKILKSRVSEMRFPNISAELFFNINATENVVVSCLFYPSLAFSVIYNKKWGKTMLKTGGLQAKGKTSTLEKVKSVIYIIINGNVLVLINVQNC